VSIELLPAARGGPRNGPSPGLAHVCKLWALGLHDFFANIKANLMQIWA
jgi:hypothetical protein